MKHHLASARSKVGAATSAQLVWILAAGLPELGIAPGDYASWYSVGKGVVSLTYVGPTGG